MSVPPSAAALVLSLVLAVISDWQKIRAPFIAFSLALAIVGAGILLNVHHNTPLEYAAICLIAMGTYSSMPLVICWYTMNLRGHWERGIGTAWQVGFGNIGGIVATFAFVSSDAPYYTRGYAALMTGLCITALSSLVYLVLVWRENRAARWKVGTGNSGMALTAKTVNPSIL